MKRIYYIIFVLLLSLLSGSQAYAQLSKSGTWASQKIEANTSVTITGEVYVAGPIIIPNGKTLTIKRNSTGDDEIRIRPLSTYKAQSGYPTCLFYVEQGGKLVITGHEGKYIAVAGQHKGTRVVPNPFTDSSQPRYTTTEFNTQRSTVWNGAKIPNPSVTKDDYLDFNNGGLICAVGEVQLQYVWLYDCVATDRGGAIYRPAQTASTNYKYGKVIVKNSNITNNMASYGGAVMIDRQYAEPEDATNNPRVNCLVQLQDCYINNNITITDSDAGAIRACPDVLGNLYLLRCEVLCNYSYGSGAAIYWNARAYDASLVIEDSAFRYNHSQGHGGAIMLEGPVDFRKTSRRNFIEYNVADCDGDGTGDGGGIYIRTDGLEDALATKSTVKMNLGADVSIKKNQARNGAGLAIHLVPKQSGNRITNATITLDSLNLSENTALNNGGGVYLLNNNTTNTVTVTLKPGSTIRDNSAGQSGGGVSIHKGTSMTNPSNSTIKLNGGSIERNKATNGAGGGVFIKGQNVTSDSGAAGMTIASNTSKTNGGGISVDGTGENVSITISNGTIGGDAKGNTSETRGGIYVKNATLLINGGVIKQNSSTKGGGGGVAALNSNVTVSGGSILNNNSNIAGGAIYLENGSLDITDGTLSQNSSGNNGGAIFFTSPGRQFTLNGGTVSYNTATGGNGGGIYVGNGSLRILKGVVDNNKTTTSHGGGVAFMPEDEGEMIMDGGVISNNSSYSNAGGIYFCSGTLQISNGEIFGNKAGQEGGGLAMRDVEVDQFTYQPTLATISGGKFYNNSANLGGGIHLETAGTMNIEGGEIYQNSCTYQGGGINVEKSGGVTITNGAIRNNEAIHGQNSGSGNGGGILLGADGGHLQINGGAIRENIGYSGSGIYMTGGSCAIEGGVIDKNVASQNGGGFYLTGSSSTVEMTGGQISNNIARVGGGVFLIAGARLTFNDGLIINNKATCVDNALAPKTGYYWDPSTHNYQGLGGGVSVANAKLIVGNETSVGIYGNIADVLGDDVYSTGRGNSEVYLPNIKNMNLTGYNTATTDLRWIEDYANGDTGYANGTKANTAQGYIPKRYREALEDKEKACAVEILDNGKTFTEYLALAVGYEVMNLTLQRKGLMKGENAIYKVSIWNESAKKWDFYAQVLISGPQEATTPEAAGRLAAEKNIVIYSGTWRVEEIGWDWAYEGNSMIEREVTSLSSLTDRTFTFTATKTTDLKESQYSESVVVNDFSSGEVVTK